MKKTLHNVLFGIYISIILIIFLLLIFSFIVHYNAKHTSCEYLSVTTKVTTKAPTKNSKKITTAVPTNNPTAVPTAVPTALNPDVRNRILESTWYTPNAISPMIQNKPSVSATTQNSLNNMNKNTNVIMSTIKNNQSSVFKLF